MIRNWMCLKRVPVSLAGLGTVILAANAAAQSYDSNKPTEAHSAADSTLGEIIVTARRREESLQSVPVAITALSGKELTAASIVKLDELPQKSPGLTIQPSSWGNAIPGFTIRSQRQIFPYLVNDPSVVVYFADVPLARPHGLNAALYDLSLVQVLKGPQGTLFGRNSTGGAVVIQPNNPTDTFGGYVKATAGNYGLFGGEGALNLPINDVLQLRVAANVRRHDGYTHSPTTGQDFDDEKTKSWRTILRFVPTEGFENLLMAYGFREHDASTGYRIGTFDPNGLSAALYPNLVAEAARAGNSDLHTTTSNLRGDNTNVRTLGVSNQTKIELGATTLKNIFGYRKVNSAVLNDYDGTSQTIFHAYEFNDSKQFTDELQLQGTGLNDRLKWIVGAFYFREEGNAVQTNTILGNTAFESQITYPGDARNTAASGFAQATYALPFVEGLSLTGGLRYTRDNRYFASRQHDLLTGQCTLRDDAGNALDPCFRSTEATFSKVTYEITVDYKVNNDMLVYATHRRGYRSGGFALGATYPEEFDGYRPETVEDYEVGLKTSWTGTDVQGHANLAVYYQDYQDIQRQVTVQRDNALIFPIINAGSAKVQGLELEVGAALFERLKVNAFYAYSDPSYKEFKASDGTDLSNNAFNFAPKNLLGGDITVTLLRPESGGEISVRGDVFYQSETFVDTVNRTPRPSSTVIPGERLPAFTTVNGRLSWNEIARSGVDASLWVRNAANRKYFVSGANLYPSLGFAGAFAAAPRTFGIDLTYSF